MNDPKGWNPDAVVPPVGDVYERERASRSHSSWWLVLVGAVLVLGATAKCSHAQTVTPGAPVLGAPVLTTGPAPTTSTVRSLPPQASTVAAAKHAVPQTARPAPIKVR